MLSIQNEKTKMDMVILLGERINRVEHSRVVSMESIHRKRGRVLRSWGDVIRKAAGYTKYIDKDSVRQEKVEGSAKRKTDRNTEKNRYSLTDDDQTSG